MPAEPNCEDEYQRCFPACQYGNQQLASLSRAMCGFLVAWWNAGRSHGCPFPWSPRPLRRKRELAGAPILTFRSTDNIPLTVSRCNGQRVAQPVSRQTAARGWRIHWFVCMRRLTMLRPGCRDGLWAGQGRRHGGQCRRHPRGQRCCAC